jgi:predicted RNase H-like nuclease (RuvC/YqgF family)
MKFDYSYRAFIITSLIFGCLFLILYSVKLGAGFPVDETSYDVEYSDELPIPEEDLAKLTAAEQRAIETNKAFNEAEKFISDLERSESEIDDKLAELDAAINDTEYVSDEGIKEAREKLKEARETALRRKRQKKAESGSGNRNTTISYELLNRRDLNIPNPVYTCDRGGIIVIDIQVNALGKVTKTNYNKKASSTQNGCLIESAITYAKKARFNTVAAAESQKGTITYNFPGQQ